MYIKDSVFPLNNVEVQKHAIKTGGLNVNNGQKKAVIQETKSQAPQVKTAQVAIQAIAPKKEEKVTPKKQPDFIQEGFNKSYAKHINKEKSVPPLVLPKKNNSDDQNSAFYVDDQERKFHKRMIYRANRAIDKEDLNEELEKRNIKANLVKPRIGDTPIFELEDL